MLEREEYIEQAYFFRILRERLEEKMPTQEVLGHISEEILATTRLPMAIDFLATEIKHTGQLSSGFRRLPHYFTPFQAFVIAKTEEDRLRFSVEVGLAILERQAQYLAGTPIPAGMFVYQLEAMSRNRLGYEEGLLCLQQDPIFDADWQGYIDMVRRQLGAVEFSDLIYVRSEFYVRDQRRKDPNYEPPVPPLFAEKEGKIAKANHGRDPLYLFAALQRQLGYPEVPRFKARDDVQARIEILKVKIKEMEMRLKLVEGEVKGHVDLSEFMAKPENFPKDDD